MGTQTDIRDERYRAEPDIRASDISLKRVEYNIMSDIGQYFFTDIWYSTSEYFTGYVEVMSISIFILMQKERENDTNTNMYMNRNMITNTNLELWTLNPEP